MNHTPFALSALLLAAAAAAQSAAPFAGTPVQISLTQAAGGPNALLKCDGFAAAPPIVWPAGPGPRFDLDWAFRNLISAGCSIGTSSPLPDIDAMSIGLDWVLSDATGKVDVPAGRWGALDFSVASGAVGVAGSVVAQEAASPGGAGADMFSYVLPGSVAPAHLVGRTKRALEQAEVGLPNLRRDIDGLDQFIPLYRLDPATLAPVGGLPTQPTLYFSVTNATLTTVPASWWANTPPSGATILATTWNTAAMRWGCVQPWKTFRDLGLDQCEDVDALAADVTRSRLLFSTRIDRVCKPIPRPQILFLDCTADAPVPVEYTTQGGQPVSDAAGLLRSDEVDAVCSLDPFAPLRGTNPPRQNTMRVAYGTPEILLTFPGVTPSLEGSSFLGCWPGAGPALLTSYGLGWPGAARAPGFAAAYATFPGFAVPPILLGGFVRNPASVFEGDPMAVTIPIPAGVRFLNPALRIAVTWVAIETATSRLGQAHRVGIDL